MKTLRHYLDVTLGCIRMAFLTMVEYPSAVAGWLISNPLQFIVGFATIRFVVLEFGSVNGWDGGQLAFLYGISVLSHALSMIFFVQGWFMGYFVIDGEFDRYLTRPMSVIYQFFFTQINIFGVTDLVPGLIVFIYGCRQVSFGWSLRNVLMLLALLAGATLIRGGIYIMIGTSSFFTRSVNDFGGYTQEIFDKTTMYPLSMYPETVQFLLTYIIPIGWVSFYPVSGLLGKGFSYAPLVTLIIGIIVISIAAAIFKAGLKKYESAGS